MPNAPKKDLQDERRKEETGVFIRDMTAELAGMAHATDQSLLAFLLRMAWLEAREQTSSGVDSVDPTNLRILDTEKLGYEH
jgi:hypothetical protein